MRRILVVLAFVPLLGCGARTELGDDSTDVGVDSRASDALLDADVDEGHVSSLCALHTGPIDDCDAAAVGDLVGDCEINPGTTCEYDWGGVEIWGCCKKFFNGFTCSYPQGSVCPQ